MDRLLTEAEVYKILQERGLAVPLFNRCEDVKSLSQTSFQAGDPVVIKGEVEGIEHKSDLGLVQMIDFSLDRAADLLQQWQSRFKDKFKAILIVERVKFSTLPSMPTELFLSIRHEDSFGHVARLGIGGIHSEFWAKAYPPVLLTAAMTLSEALEKISYHYLGHLWFGLFRQQEALLTVDTAKKFVSGILQLLQQEDLPELIEINPIVIAQERFVALDGLGVAANSTTTLWDRELPIKALLNPSSLAIAGVSSKKKAFGNLILDNILRGGIVKEQIKIIKEGDSPYVGITSYADISWLKEKPVDNLILALPPKACLATIKDLCEQGGGAEVTYLVAGGIGDGADHDGLGQELRNYLKERREQGLWTTKVVGPNSLGIILAPLKLNTLFISPERLPIQFSSVGKVAFLSQSGAFFITRLSRFNDLPIKYAFCIGNQLDISMGELLEVCATDNDIEVFSLYLEGVQSGDLHRITNCVKQLHAHGKKVVVYKGGRSEQGAAAAAGHTGSIAGVYAFEQEVLQSAGAIVCDTMEEFSLKTSFFAKFKQEIKHIGVISNAGFETVRAADIFGEQLKKLSNRCLEKLNEQVAQEKLGHLVTAANPMDITPMASESLYLKSATTMLAEVDLLIVSLVPLTEMLAVEGQRCEQFAQDLSKLQLGQQKPVVVVIDSGELYDGYRSYFAQHGLMVFNAVEQVATLLT